MSEYFVAKLNQVHELIDEGNYQMAIELSRNLKNKVVDKTIVDKIEDFEKKVEENFDAEWEKMVNSTGGPNEKQTKALHLLKLKSQKYEKFYLKIDNDYDL